MKLLLAFSLLMAGTHLTDCQAMGKVAPSGPRSITLVVKLLKNMLETSRKTAEEERVSYAKFKCYCDSEEEAKSKAIEQATKLISLLEAKIEELQGSNGELSSKAAKLKEDLADNKQKREVATALRNKEKAAFEATKADLEQAISQLTDAIRVLASVGADQTKSVGADHKQFMRGKMADKAGLLSLKSSVQSALLAAEAFMTEEQHQKVVSFVQAPFTGTYTAQSGEIVGILKNMKATFAANLKTAIETESAQAKAYHEFMTTSLAAEAEMKALYADAQEELGDNDQELSDKREQLDAAEKEKANDEEFLEKLRPMCADEAEAYEHRNEVRAQEEVAIAEAISILNSDSAFETFGTVDATSARVGPPGPLTFLQTVQKHFPGVSDEDVRKVMQRVLRKAAAGRDSPRLAHVISTLQAENPFDTVLNEIDKMIDLIEEESRSDKEKLDWCITERKENKADLKEKKKEILRLEAKMDELDNLINDPEKGLKAQIEETEMSLEENHNFQVHTTATRKEDNVAYQKSIANMVEAEKLIENAIKVLKSFYERETISLIQKEDPAPPPVLAAGPQNTEGNSAIKMLEYILAETKKEENEAHSDEKKAQHEYEDMMETTTTEEAKMERNLVGLKEALAEAESSLQKATEDHKATVEDRLAIEAYLEKIKPGCDFITKNFGVRSKNRIIEKEALEKAQEALKGSPAYKKAVAEATVESYGKCKEPCVKDKEDVKCKACMADVTIPGYCAGHPLTKGCNEMEGPAAESG